MVEREENGTFWIYVVDGERKVPIREITWMAGERGEGELWVGVFVGKPKKSEEGKEKSLEVTFKDWELDVV